MKSAIYLTQEEYDSLVKRAEMQDVMCTVSGGEIMTTGAGDWVYPTYVKIHMRELKLQICRQNDIDIENTVVEFY